ncbi:MAG: hypothetical protein N3A66_01020 [Planctomycetota bacterium]|nr:hypothetical protein [Planctomycetota bacterium]
MSRNLGITLLLALSLALGSGCELFHLFGYPAGNRVPYNPKEEGGEVAIKRDIQFADIPVPLGFILRRNNLFSFQGSSFRFGRFTYEGAWTLKKTVEFYKEELPKFQWQLATASHSFDIRKSTEIENMLYTKGRERLRVVVISTPEGITVEIRLYNVSIRSAEMAKITQEADALAGQTPNRDAEPQKNQEGDR